MKTTRACPIVDLDSGQSRGRIKVAEEPEGVGVNPANGEVYVTCEEKGEVFAIDPGQQRVIATIETGGRPRSVAFSRDGSRAYVACENGGYVAVVDAREHKLLSKIQLPTGSLPMGTAVSRDGKSITSQLAAATQLRSSTPKSSMRKGRLSSPHEERGRVRSRLPQ